MMPQRSNLTEPLESVMERVIPAVWQHGGDEVRRLASPNEVSAFEAVQSVYGVSLEDLAVHCKIAECIHGLSISDALRRTQKVPDRV
jgi:hypothetical protein